MSERPGEKKKVSAQEILRAPFLTTKLVRPPPPKENKRQPHRKIIDSSVRVPIFFKENRRQPHRNHNHVFSGVEEEEEGEEEEEEGEEEKKRRQK